MPERDPFDDRLERQLVDAAQQLERRGSSRRRDGARARIAIGAATAVAALGSLTLAIVLVDGGAERPPAATTLGEAAGCAPFVQHDQVTVERMTPPAIVLSAAPSLSPGALRGGGRAAAFCPVPLDVGAIFDPRLVAAHGSARGAAAVYLSALRGPARSGVAPDRGFDRGDRSWKVCLSLGAGRRPDPVAIACEEPDRVLDSGLVARLRRPGALTLFVFYVASDADRLRLRFADGGTATTTLDAGVGSILRRDADSDPARTPVAYQPVRRDGTPLDGGGSIDYTR